LSLQFFVLIFDIRVSGSVTTVDLVMLSYCFHYRLAPIGAAVNIAVVLPRVSTSSTLHEPKFIKRELVVQKFI